MDSEITEILSELDSMSLFGTYHTSAYLPAEETRESILEKLNNEIHNVMIMRITYPLKTNRRHILDEVESVVNFFNHIMERENGVVIFCGLRKTTDYGLYVPIIKRINLPKPIKYQFHIGKRFVTKPAWDTL